MDKKGREKAGMDGARINRSGREASRSDKLQRSPNQDERQRGAMRNDGRAPPHSALRAEARKTEQAGLNPGMGRWRSCVGPGARAGVEEGRKSWARPILCTGQKKSWLGL